MVEPADASGEIWRELDDHYAHQSRMIDMAVDIRSWEANSAEYRSMLAARLRDLPPADAMQLLQFLDLIPRPADVEPQLAKTCRERARLWGFTHDGSWGTPAERSRPRSVDPPARDDPLWDDEAYQQIYREFCRYDRAESRVRHKKVPGAHLWISWRDIKSTKIAVVIAVASGYLATNSVSMTALNGTATALFAGMKRMSDEEIEVLAVMARLSGGDIYHREIATRAILDALPPEESDKQKSKLLNRMKDRGMLAESDGDWKVVR